MKKYIVFYTTKATSDEVTSFDTLEEAINYCNEETRGKEEAEGDIDNDLNGYFFYEVYDADKATFDDPGEPVYTTTYYWM